LSANVLLVAIRSPTADVNAAFAVNLRRLAAARKRLPLWVRALLKFRGVAWMRRVLGAATSPSTATSTRTAYP